MAELISTWSKDPSTQCGAVIVDRRNRVVSVGFNGFPAGVSDRDDHYQNREEKYRRVIHAEKNAILFAKQDLTGCTLYVYPMPPCSQCAAAIIQSGIKQVVTVEQSAEQAERWGKDIAVTQEMFAECGVVMSMAENIYPRQAA